MKKIKAIFCDLDGTLLINDTKLFHPLFENNYLKAMEENGISFSLCTGRLFEEAYSIFERLGKNSNAIPYLICSNGSQIYDTRKKQLILNKGFSEKTIEKIYKICSQVFLKNEFVQIVFYKTNGDIIVWPELKELSEMVKNNESLQEEMSTWKREFFLDPSAEGKQIFKHVILHDSVPYIEKKKEQLKLSDLKNLCKVVVLNLKKSKISLFDFFEVNLKSDKSIHLSFSSKHSIEISLAQHTKGDSVEYITKLEKINPENVLVCGDAGNDASMFNKFINSACPEWAEKEILDIATYHFKGEPGEWPLKAFDRFVFK